MTRQRPRKVVLAAGGTGGHLFPAQALARELLARDIAVVLITDRRGGGFGPDMAQVEAHAIAAGGIAGTGLLRRIKNLALLGLGTLQARAILRRIGTDCVVGFGGYPSVPPVLAGAQLGLSIVLHEQNAVLGRANRRLCRYARALCTSFRSVQAIVDDSRGKVALTGNPVRTAILDIGRRPFAVPGPGDPLQLLVTGGSQGAAVFNDLVPAAVAELAPALRQRLKVTQQVPGAALEAVAARYRNAGVAAELAGFFDDMPRRLEAAHLVISRAGASSVAELAGAGRPAILVPLPTATDDHQTANAQALCEVGGGWLMPQASLTAEGLAERLAALLEAPALLTRAAHCAGRGAHRQAAIRLAQVVCGEPLDDRNGDHESKEAAA